MHTINIPENFQVFMVFWVWQYDQDIQFTSKPASHLWLSQRECQSMWLNFDQHLGKSLLPQITLGPSETTDLWQFLCFWFGHSFLMSTCNIISKYLYLSESVSESVSERHICTLKCSPRLVSTLDRVRVRFKHGRCCKTRIHRAPLKLV